MDEVKDQRRELQKNDVVRYVGREHQNARGQLFRVVQMSATPEGKVQLGAVKDGMPVSDVKGVNRAWWVAKPDIEFVGAGAMTIGSFRSGELDVTPKTGHEHEAKRPRTVTLAPAERSKPQKPTESPVTQEDADKAQVEPSAAESKSDGTSKTYYPATGVWVLTVCAGTKRMQELYRAESGADDRRRDVSSVLGSLGIEYTTDCRWVEVK